MTTLKKKTKKDSTVLNQPPDAFEVWRNLDAHRATEQWRSLRPEVNPLGKLLRKQEASKKNK